MAESLSAARAHIVNLHVHPRRTHDGSCGETRPLPAFHPAMRPPGFSGVCRASLLSITRILLSLPMKSADARRPCVASRVPIRSAQTSFCKATHRPDCASGLHDAPPISDVDPFFTHAALKRRCSLRHGRASVRSL